MTNFDKVKEFHESFGVEGADDFCTVKSERVRLRLRLIVEELDELFESTYGTSRGEVSNIVWDGLERRGKKYPLTLPTGDYSAMSVEGTADALIDLLYVIYGACHEFGLNADRIFDEVHRSNMSKLAIDGKPIYREDGKILKGPDFFEPDIWGAIYSG